MPRRPPSDDIASSRHCPEPEVKSVSHLKWTTVSRISKQFTARDCDRARYRATSKTRRTGRWGALWADRISSSPNRRKHTAASREVGWRPGWMKRRAAMGLRGLGSPGFRMPTRKPPRPGRAVHMGWRQTRAAGLILGRPPERGAQACPRPLLCRGEWEDSVSAPRADGVRHYRGTAAVRRTRVRCAR